MAFNISRYTNIYRGMLRPDLAQNFPRRVFLREPNYPNPNDNIMNGYLTKQ